MKRITKYLGVIALVAFATAGCKKKEEKKKPDQKKPVPTKKTEKPAEAKKVAVADTKKPADMGPPPVSVIVLHKIGDWGKWKKAFDTHRPKRKEAGFVAELVGHAAGDKSMVWVHLIGTDMAKAKAMLGSDDLKNAMKDSGVVGKPNIMVGKNVALSPKGTAKGLKNSILVVHEVNDFAAWKKAYDEHADARTKAGLAAGGVMQFDGNPNKVAVFALGADAKKIVDFTKSEDLKKAMQKAGVKGKPEITLGMVMELNDY